MIRPQKRTATGGEYENIFPFKVLLRDKPLKPDIMSREVDCGTEAYKVVFRQVSRGVLSIDTSSAERASPMLCAIFRVLPLYEER